MSKLIRIILAAFLVFSSLASAQPAHQNPTSGTATTPENAATMTPIGETRSIIDSSTLPRDLTPWGMFIQADWVVKAVMIGLAIASVITWTVWLVKTMELATANRESRRVLGEIRQAKGLAEAARAVGLNKQPAAALVRAAMTEATASADGRGEGLLDRVSLQLERIQAAAGRRMNIGTGILATIGATSPFVGLFGTVWGIMNAFIGISKAQTTNLAVVAPGIAEALLTTAFGLLAAIPAVVIYNFFARSIFAYRAQLTDASAEVLKLLSRDMDRAGVQGLRVQRTAG